MFVSITIQQHYYHGLKRIWPVQKSMNIHGPQTIIPKDFGEIASSLVSPKEQVYLLTKDIAQSNMKVANKISCLHSCSPEDELF